MMTKIGNMQKIMIFLDIFAEEKSFLNWPENLPLKYQALVLGHPVYLCVRVINVNNEMSKTSKTRNIFKQPSFRLSRCHAT